MLHIPVLLKEIIQFLDPKPNQHFIDATIGEGGHTKAILEKTAPHGIVLGIDRDIQQLERAQKELSEFGNRVIFVNDSFGKLENLISKYPKKWQGILFDLGWSLAQLESSGRGFSFLKDEELDMRYGLTPLTSFQQPASSLTAKYIVNKWSQNDIEKILREYGEERFRRQIANAIVEARKEKPFLTTFQLVEVIKKAIPLWYHHKNRHPATKIFQALRIAVNNEFEEIEKGLRGAVEAVALTGRIAVISFHSGEDRIVKKTFKEFEAMSKGTNLTKKPIRPLAKEIKGNPHARSAKLRVFEVNKIIV